MRQRERLRRADPERTGPIHDWSKLYRADDSFDSRKPELDTLTNGNHGQPPGVSEAAYRGVELGYQVVDKHIREGRAAAQRCQRTGSAQTTRRDAMDEIDAERIIERAFRAISDLLPVWRDVLNSIAAATFSRTSSTSANPGPPVRNELSAECAVAVELTAARPTRVTLALPRGYAQIPLVVGALHALDPDKPPVTGIDFIPACSGERACVRIRLPSDQPPGVYAGILADKESEEPCGTLTIRIT